MTISTTFNGDRAEISFSGRFVFSDSSAFRAQLASVLDKGVKHCVCNLADLTFMDSSGLGMLMVALKECQKRNIELEVAKPQGDVKALLEMTKTHERIRITS